MPLQSVEETFTVKEILTEHISEDREFQDKMWIYLDKNFEEVKATLKLLWDEKTARDNTSILGANALKAIGAVLLTLLGSCIYFLKR